MDLLEILLVFQKERGSPHCMNPILIKTHFARFIEETNLDGTIPTFGAGLQLLYELPCDF